jgi:transposase
MEDASRSRAMTVREVAGYLNVNEKTVYRLAQRRELLGLTGRHPPQPVRRRRGGSDSIR